MKTPSHLFGGLAPLCVALLFALPSHADTPHFDPVPFGEFQYPQGSGAANGEVHVSDPVGGAVHVYSSESPTEGEIRSYAVPGYPRDVALDAAGNSYVTTYLGTVEVFDPSGIPLQSIDLEAAGVGTRAFPMGIAALPDGNLVVGISPTEHARIAVISPIGELVALWDAPGVYDVFVHPGTGEIWSANWNSVSRWTATGEKLGEFGVNRFGVIGITGDGAGRIFLSYYYSTAVEQWTEAGAFKRRLDLPAGDNPPQPYCGNLFGVTYASPYLFATERVNHRTLRLSPVDLPAIAQQPQSLRIRPGGSVSFSVQAIGDTLFPGLEYQWYKNGAPLTDATGDSLNISPASSAHQGGYAVVVCNGGGCVTSAVARLTVQATFTAGRYAGLGWPDGEVLPVNSGSMNLTVTVRGQFTGSLNVGPWSLALAGTADPATAQARLMATSSGGAVPISLDFNDPYRITATVTLRGVDAQFALGFVSWSSSRPCPFAGQYTIILPFSEDGDGPQADGFATVNVSSDGRAAMTVKLADGISASASACVTEEGCVPLRVALERGTGHLLGLVALGEEVSGRLDWVKPASNRGAFADGFAVSLESFGALWHRSEPAFGLGEPMLLTLSGGDLDNSVEIPIRILPSGQITSDQRGVKLSIKQSTGLITGSVFLPGRRRPVTFNGAIVQGANAAYGFAASANGPISVTVFPATN